MNDEDLDTAIRALAAERRLPAPHIARWLAMDAASRAAFLELARNLRLRTGQLATALDLLGEIRVREQTAVAEVLARDELRRIANGPGSAPARASTLLETLRAMRFPQLTKVKERLNTEVAALKLPRGISVVLPNDLASDELSVSVRARTGAELGRLLDQLERKKSGLMRILEILGGDSPDDEKNEV